MPEQIANCVGETTTTTGTGTLSLGGKITGKTSAYQGFVEAGLAGNTCRFMITDGTDFEVTSGLVTDAAPDTLTRVTVEESSNGGAKVDWGPGTKYVYNVHSAAGVPQIITENTTLYVATGGDNTNPGTAAAPWATYEHARDYLSNYWVAEGVTVTVEFGDGDFELTDPFGIDHPCWRQILWQGENVHSKSVTSIQSTAGSKGNYTYVLNMDSVADIAVDDIALIYGYSGGTKGGMVEGVGRVTNVDSGNTRITISATNSSGGGHLPSGAVSASVKIIKTRFDCATNSVFGIKIDGEKGIRISNMAFYNDGGGEYAGYIKKGGALWMTGTVAFWKFQYPLRIDNFGSIIGGRVGVSGCTSGGGCQLLDSVAANIAITTAVICWNDAPGMSLDGSAFAWFHDLSTSGNDHHGLTGGRGGRVRVDGTHKSHGNTYYGCDATGGVYMKLDSTDWSNNTIGDSSPAVNTVGNEEAYIDT